MQCTIISQTHSEPCETSKMELFAKLVNHFQSLNIFPKSSILDIYQGSDYASDYMTRCILANVQIKRCLTDTCNLLKCFVRNYLCLRLVLHLELEAYEVRFDLIRGCY